MLSQQALEEAVLCLMCFHEQAPTVVLQVTESRIFSNRTSQLLAATAIDYVRKYRTCPGKQLEYILENELKRGEEGKLIAQQIEFLSKQVEQLDVTFIIDQLSVFLEHQTLSNSLQEAMETLQEGDIEKARKILFNNQSYNSLNGSPGISLLDPKQAFKFLDKEEETDYFSSGISIFDRRGIRPERKTLMFLIAAAKKGKSWWLIGVGKGGLQYHHKVLHITLELSEEKTAKRYLQSIFGLTSTDLQKIRTPYFIRDAATNSTSIDFNEIERDSVVNKRQEVAQKLRAMGGSYSSPLIKEFPTGSLSTEQLLLYLDQLEREGYKPDLLVLDYADLMKIDAQSLRIDTGRLYRDLRGISVSKGIAIVTASQGNRDSETAKLVGKTNVAEDWSKVGTADTILTYSQTAQERRLGLARVFAAAVRDEADMVMALLSQSYATGQFAIDSTFMDVDLTDQIERLGA